LPQTAPHFQGITLLSSGIHTPSFSAIAVLSELLSMVHPVLEMSAIDLRAQGDSTHEMVYHTAAHGQVNALNFGADCFFQSVKGCGFSPQKNNQKKSRAHQQATSERGCEPPVSENRQISSETRRKNKLTEKCILLHFLS